MAEPVRIRTRLRKIPADLLFAVTNATAILVIAAAILAIVAMIRIDSFAERVVGTMTEAVLSKLDLPPKGVLENLRGLREEVRALGNTLREIKIGDNPIAQSRIERLKEASTALHESIDRLTNSSTILTDEAIAQLGRVITDMFANMRSCSSNPLQTHVPLQ